MGRLVSAFFLSVVLFLGGCASTGPTTSYNASTDKTTIRLGSMTVGQKATGSIYSNTSVIMKAKATCMGRDCTPSSTELTFEIQGGSDVTFSGHTLLVEADGKRFSWKREVQWDSPEDRRAREGQTVKVTIPLSKLDAIANASSVSGRLGEMSLNLEGHVQSNLSSFVEKAKNPEVRASETS